MSLAEVMPFGDEGSRSTDRTPPQDMAAEQCVLGAMMMSKDAIADVVESLRGPDFYRPAHEQVYDAILDLYGRGEPADAITVAAELTKRGEIGRVGGAPYLHTLLASVPVAANAGYYAEIVREKGILRRLVDASIRIGQMSYAAQGDVDVIVDRAQAEVYAVTERRASEDYKPLSELMQPTLDEMEAISSRGGQLAGVPTGFLELDDLTNGLHPGQMVIVAARPGCGKALALDTALPTPYGWTTMGEVELGDELIDASGRPTRVLAATDVMRSRPCYRVTFSDGTSVIADAHHEWAVSSAAASRDASGDRVLVGSVPGSVTLTAVRPRNEGRAPETQLGRVGHLAGRRMTVTTAELATCVTLSDGRPNWSVEAAKPLQLEQAALPVAPYDLGVRLAEGCGQQLGSGLGFARREAERIPAIYLRAAEAQRNALLTGLLDNDGTVVEFGRMRLRLSSQELADDVYELATSLGHVCDRSSRLVAEEGGTARTAFEIALNTADASGGPRRYVTSVEPVPSVPVRCVQVDNPEHLFLATRAMIPTHNSTLALDLARSASIKHGLTSAIFSLEMSQIEITMRLLSAEASIPLSHIRGGKMSDDDWSRVATKMGQVSEAPMFIDDSPNLTMMEIRAKARRLKQRHDLKLVVIDYIQLMTSGKKVESRQLEVSEFSRQLKLLAKELEVPVVALSQLNRGPEQRTDKKPMLSDLRESGSLEQDADMVVLLHRPDLYDKESERAGEADFIVAKHRNGPTKDITVAFQGHYSRFTDMQH